MYFGDKKFSFGGNERDKPKLSIRVSKILVIYSLYNIYAEFLLIFF